MALKDVKNYYYHMLMQYLEEKQNLADFSEALKDGLITEEQMSEAMATVSELENNYHRLAYIMFLFSLPNRDTKKKTYLERNSVLTDEFKRLGVDLDSIKQENTDALLHFKAALEALKEKDEY